VRGIMSHVVVNVCNLCGMDAGSVAAARLWKRHHSNSTWYIQQTPRFVPIIVKSRAPKPASKRTET